MKPPARFIVVGGANTAIGLAAIYAGKWMGLADGPANASGYVIGLCVSFALNKAWTFTHGGPTAPLLARFVLVFGASYCLNLVTVMQAIARFGVNPYVAQTLGIVPYAACMYVGCRHFVFCKPLAAHATRPSGEPP